MNEKTEIERCCVCGNTDIFRCGVYCKDPVVCRGCDRIVFDHFNYDEGKPLSKKQIRQCKRFRLKRVLDKVLDKVKNILKYVAGFSFVYLFGVPLGVFCIGYGFWQLLVERNPGSCSISRDRDRSAGPAWWEPIIISPLLMFLGLVSFGIFLDMVFGTCLTSYCRDGWFK